MVRSSSVETIEGSLLTAKVHSALRGGALCKGAESSSPSHFWRQPSYCCPHKTCVPQCFLHMKVHALLFLSLIRAFLTSFFAQEGTLYNFL